jgi:type I restriction enzyme, S subunit
VSHIKLKQYNFYNDVDLIWIDILPSNWTCLRLKDIIAKLESGVSVNASDVPVQGSDFGVLKTSCVGNGTFLPNQNKTVWPTEIGRLRVPVSTGSIIVSRMNTPDLVGASAYIPVDYPNLFLPDRLWQTIFYAKAKLDSKWLSFLISGCAFRFLLSTLATGTSPSMKNLGQEKFLNIEIPFPLLYEQSFIANYLDTKTVQIDHRIDLLTLKAQKYTQLKESLINESVTCGLDKTVGMKDSRIDWIGKVPEHWEIKRLKDLATQSKEKNGLIPIGEMLSVSGYRGIEVKVYENEVQKRTEEELVDYRVVHPGQLVVNTMWLNYRGIGVSQYEGYISPAYRAYYLSCNVVGSFLHYLMRSDLYVFGYSKYLQGIRPNSLQMKTIDFECLPIIMPDREEQLAIAEFLNEKTSQIDCIIETIHKQIDKLKELRKTLINDVVTGKIKVVKEEQTT